jgi:hypothetical protein
MSIENLRSEYQQARDKHEKTLEKVHSQLPSTTMTDEQITTFRQYLLLSELHQAKAKLRLDIAISQALTRYGQRNITDLPKLAITKGWLDESLRRMETPELKGECESGSLFWELSHFFLATIILQHQHSMFEGRQLPSVHGIAEIFQQKEPRSHVPGLGPFLELATGLTTDDPLLMPEILRRLETRMASDTSLNRNLDTDTSLRKVKPQLEYQSRKPRKRRSPIYWTMDNGTVNEIDPYLDSPWSASSSPAHSQTHTYEDNVEKDVESLQVRNSIGRENDREEDMYQVREPEYDPVVVAPSLATNSPIRETKLEDEQDTGRSDDIVNGEIQRIDDRIDDIDRTMIEEVAAQEAESDVDMDHQDKDASRTANPRPFYAIREASTGLEASRSLSLVSDFSTFDEVMQDVPEVEGQADKQPSISVSQTASQAYSRFHIPDSFVIGDDELEPDSNPFLAAHRAKIPASASASTSSTPASSAPVVTLSDFSRSVVPRKSEPVVLISSPVRPSQRPTGNSGSQQHSTRISDSMFISDDELPPSSNPHLAALIRARASASAPASGSSTPTSSASTRTAKPKLPPHLARVRKAAHRQSLDPSSQVPTAEEKQILDQEEYPLIDIIDEKAIDGEKKYLIKWKPIHGRQFLDTWEPAENANAASVEDWEIEKTRRAKALERRKMRRAKRGPEVEQRRKRKHASEAAAEPANQASVAQDHPLTSSLPEDTPIFFTDTVGDQSLASRGTRFVPALHTPSPSPASSLSADQVSSRTRSRANVEEEPLPAATKSIFESIVDSPPEPESGPLSEYTAQRFFINAVSPAPQPAPASSSKPDNSDKYKTPNQQKARMREKREIRRAEKAERLANMTEDQRAKLEHSKQMHKKAKRERKMTKAAQAKRKARAERRKARKEAGKDAEAS